jgi:hypothetical protein
MISLLPVVNPPVLAPMAIPHYKKKFTFPKSPSDNIDLSQAPIILRRALSGLAYSPDPMAIVYKQQSPVFIRLIYHLIKRGNIPIHAEHPIRCNQFEPRTFRLFLFLLKIPHIKMRISIPAGFG